MNVTDRQIVRDRHELSQQYTVKQPQDRHLILLDWRYPDGWQPQTAPLLIRYPKYYPRMQPGIYLPTVLEYTQGRVSHMYRTDTLDAPGMTGDWRWVRWCTHHMPWDGDLQTFLTHLIQPSLNRPQSTNPIQKA